LSFDDASKPCRDGLMKTMQQINVSSKGISEDERKERAAHGMADPEIQVCHVNLQRLANSPFVCARMGD
jgi:hypothetical protein